MMELRFLSQVFENPHTVESRFFELPWKKEFGSRYREV